MYILGCKDTKIILNFNTLQIFSSFVVIEGIYFGDLFHLFQHVIPSTEPDYPLLPDTLVLRCTAKLGALYTKLQYAVHQSLVRCTPKH
jgi:hypothetical protein